MPNPHYQHVLEQDRALPAPVRLTVRLLSSWWTIILLAVPVVGYVAAAHYPVGGRYLWQHRLIDASQQQVVTWWPLQAAAVLLAMVILCAAVRRLPWRWTSLGRFVCVIGLVTILLSQSWAFRSQTTGVAAVPITYESTPGFLVSGAPTNSLGDTAERVLVVMAGGQPAAFVPLEGLPRWNDADALPDIALHTLSAGPT